MVTYLRGKKENKKKEGKQVAYQAQKRFFNIQYGGGQCSCTGTYCVYVIVFFLLPSDVDCDHRRGLIGTKWPKGENSERKRERKEKDEMMDSDWLDDLRSAYVCWIISTYNIHIPVST